MENIKFKLDTGGLPTNKIGLPIVSSDINYKYTTHDDTAYSGDVVVACEETGEEDTDGNKIYITEKGVKFIFRYIKGTPVSFDSGFLDIPNIH